MTEFPSDRASCLLAHPLRSQRFLQPLLSELEQGLGSREFSVVKAAFCRDDFTLSNLPQLIDQERLTRFGQMFELAAHSPGSTELGGAMATMVGIRHVVSPYRLFRLEDDLVALLGVTDIDEDLPISFLRLPFPRCYVELGQRRDITASVPNDVSGDHVLEGAYFEQGVHPQRGPGLYVLATGSPLGKRDCMDDATHAVFLSTCDPEMPLSAALNAAFDAAIEQSSSGGYRPPSKESFSQALANLQWLVKALLYISLPEARKTAHLDRSDLQTQLGLARSNAKRAKLQRRMARACDLVVVHAPAPRLEPPTGPTGLEAGSRAAHWRRGHYRRQAFGAHHAQRKLIFVAPVWVGSAANAAGSALKTYTVR